MIARAPKPRVAPCLALATMGFLASTVFVACAEAETPQSAQQSATDYQAPRTEWGHPDIQGNWSNATLTPFERRLGQGPVYTQAEVDQLEGRERSTVEAGSDPSDPERGPPPITGGIGRSYNQIYYDRGDRVAVVDGEPRTSLITFPSDGRIPELTPEGARRKQEYHDFRSQFGQFDHPELRPLAERCIVFYGSSSASVMGPPMTPTRGYNNNFRIVQDADHVVIMSEMIHDVRIIRLGEPNRLPAHVRPWFGDSWGHFEGNTLVVETTNIHPLHGMREQTDKIVHSPDLRAIERFTRTDDDSILYEFEIHDPRTYAEVWGGQVPWRKYDQLIYEYACHEGNYALGNVLMGARYEERMEAQGRR
jgi:hypothetical protein